MSMGRKGLTSLLFLIGTAIVARRATPLAGQEADAREIAAQCARAIGGEEGADAIRSMSFLVRPPDSDRSTYWEIQRPEKVRKERPGRWVLVFDGRRAGYLQGPPAEDGSLRGPHLVPEADWHDFELDIALFIPAFFDHPPRYLGLGTVGDTRAHILGVVLPMGDEVRYWLDAETFLPIKIYLPAWNFERYLGDWQETGGLTYFTRFWTSPDRSDLTRLDELTFNETDTESRFTLPANIRRPIRPPIPR